jgi:hypothetical protein
MLLTLTRTLKSLFGHAPRPISLTVRLTSAAIAELHDIHVVSDTPHSISTLEIQFS